MLPWNQFGVRFGVPSMLTVPARYALAGTQESRAYTAADAVVPRV